MFDFKISMDFPQHLGDGQVSPPPPPSRRRKTPSPPSSHQQHQHQHQQQQQHLLHQQQHPALRSRPGSNRSPSPTFSIDSLGEQLHPRMSTVSAISQRTMSPVTPPQAPQSDYFAVSMPRRRHDSSSAAQYPPAPHSDMLPAPLRTSTSSFDAPPPLHAAGFAPPPASSPRPSTSSNRPLRPPPSQHYPSSEDVLHNQRRRHASGDYPCTTTQHQDAEHYRTLGRRAASSERLSPPRTRRQRGPSPLRDLDRDRALPPLPPPSAAASPPLPPPSPPPAQQQHHAQHAPPDLRIQHANSAPTSALFLPDDVRLPPDLRRASSLRAAASANTAQQQHYQHNPADDVDVTDVALFAEALQGLGTMTLDAPFEQHSFSAPIASQPPPPPPLVDWSAPPPAPHAAPPAMHQALPSTMHQTLPTTTHQAIPQTMYPSAPPPRYPPAHPQQQPQPAPRAPPPSTNARAFNAGWAEVELNEAVLGLPDQTVGAARPPDDELPDYQTSQREAAERTRRAALTRAQELENRWRGSAPFRSR